METCLVCLFTNIICCLFLDIEAQIKEIQSKKKDIENINPDKGVGLGESGFFDSEIYDGSVGGKSRYDGYMTSIPTTDDADDEEYETIPFNQTKRPGYTAPAALLNDVAQVII